jgi:hypothetical protein
MSKFIVVIGAKSQAPLYVTQVRIDNGLVRAICFGQLDDALHFETRESAHVTALVIDVFITEHLPITVIEEL